MAGARLEIDGLSKRYGSVQALEGMSFDVQPGEMFGFVGSNGAGKSTTMRILVGVLRADAGQVRWGGKPIGVRERRLIGYMPEERGLYPKMKVAEQLIYLARLHGFTAAAAAQASADLLERLGLTARRSDEVQKLSLGNQQRVQLAAALVHRPELLVLDEPFSGLDPVALDVMSDVLRDRCADGVPVLFSSHQLDVVERVCDRVGIVRSGSMVAHGTVDELCGSGTVRLLVDAPAAPAGWTVHLAGVHVIEADGARWVLELGEGVDDQQVLQAALATGPVREFRRVRPGLTERFRDIVAEDVVTEDAA
jgi:ABC-2 type transport system ATP-binding protein